MAKFYGNVGYVTSEEARPGVTMPKTTERPYAGDLIEDTSLVQSSDQLNDNVNIDNRISIIADPFAYENIYAIRYVVFRGTKWKVKSAKVQYPRIILTVGGVYNGK